MYRLIQNKTIIPYDPLELRGGVCIYRDPALFLYFLIFPVFGTFLGMDNSGERWLLSLIWVGDTKASVCHDLGMKFNQLSLLLMAPLNSVPTNTAKYVFKSTQ